MICHWWSLTTWYVVHRSTIISAQSLHYQVVVFWRWSRRCIERHGDGDCYHSVVLRTSAALCVQAVLCTGVLSTRLLWWSLVYWHSHIPAESTKIVKKVKVSLYRRYFHELQKNAAQSSQNLHLHKHKDKLYEQKNFFHNLLTSSQLACFFRGCEIYW